MEFFNRSHRELDMIDRKSSGKLRKLAAASLVSLATVALSPQVFAAPAAPSLVGSWSGVHTGGAYVGSPGHSPDKSEPTLIKPGLRFTLTIKQQNDRALIGTWSTPRKTERLVGVVRLDNKTVVLADEDTHFSAVLLDANSMEFCGTEAGEISILAACLLLKKD
ncbi:MAG: hypothetical protein AB7I42_18645 [Bradyrhizobium sp.]|uniref:hypothetical protein n=1 Tax=Bradyrhizobium sp. TaxID=376 RepID=UPI003D124461